MEDRALMELILDMLSYKKKEAKFLFIALIVVVFMNIIEVVAFLVFESSMSVTTTTTTTTEQEVNGDDGNIVNGDQYNDESQNRRVEE